MVQEEQLERLEAEVSWEFPRSGRDGVLVSSVYYWTVPLRRNAARSEDLMVICCLFEFRSIVIGTSTPASPRLQMERNR